MFGGLQVHLIRYHIGLVHELCELIRHHQGVLDHPFLRSVVQQMPKPSRDSWQSLVDTATGKLASGPFANIVKRIRHKVTAHYDASEILDGYKRFFFDGPKAKRAAYISRGSNMDESRLYFADAAVQAYLEGRVGQDQKRFFEIVIGAMRDANSAIMLLVNGFIQRRGFVYRGAS